MNCTCPPSRSASAGAAPLYGTCVASTCAARLNISPAMCGELPVPAEPYDSLPGLAFMYATNSFTSFAGTDGCVTR